MLTAARLKQILAEIRRVNVGVVGDFCLDVYWILDLEAGEESVETGLTTRPVREQRYSLGGAGNVIANLSALGAGNTFAFAALGHDPFGAEMLAKLDDLAVERGGSVICADAAAWQTLAYCKPYVDNREQARLDLGNFNALPDALACKLIENLEGTLPELDVVIVNEQVERGIHTPCLQGELRSLMRRHPEKTFLFDGRHVTEAYPEACLKINASEAVRLCGMARAPREPVPREEAERAARELFSRTGKTVFVTRGDRGCILCDGEGTDRVPGLHVVGPTDPVGAGDSFLAALAASIAAGATHREAMRIANFAARVTVKKLKRTGTASPAEILQVGETPHYVHDPEIADDPRRAQRLPGTYIEVVHPLPADLRIECAIFDHDGTISTLRQGWEEVMAPMMVRAILGSHHETADEGLYRSVVARVDEYIDQTTGIQTLAQMRGLTELVREFRLVPENEILDMHGYKTVYNRTLQEKVTRRLERLRSGELSREDFSIKNAIRFVEALHARGIRCFLASGTDERDVIAEARAMGYAELFTGGIFGSVGDLNRDAKEVVLERILDRVDDLRGRVITFGDGPVEMRETRLRGGLAAGVASDEIRRFGLNAAKRSRLIRAGAGLIVPDFSQMDRLLRLLNLQ